MKLENIVKSLGLPLGIVALVVAILALFGLDAVQVAGVASTLVGAQACIAIAVNLLKWLGLVNDGKAGWWSALFNAAVFVSVAVQLGFFPSFDIASFDTQLFNFAQAAGGVLLYLIQLVGTKAFHKVQVNGFGIRAVSYSIRPEYPF